jgi:hypothetical protein
LGVGDLLEGLGEPLAVGVGDLVLVVEVLLDLGVVLLGVGQLLGGVLDLLGCGAVAGE